MKRVLVYALSLLMIFSLASCQQKVGGMSKYDSISVGNVFGDRLVLKIKCKSYASPPGPQVFLIKEDIKGLFDLINECETNIPVEAELKDNYIFLSTDTKEKEYFDKAYYMIISRGTDDDDGYDRHVLLSPIAGFLLWKNSGVGEEFHLMRPHDIVLLYLPYQFFDITDETIYSSMYYDEADYALKPGTPYEITGTIDDFKAFYEKTGGYEISQENNRLILSGNVFYSSSSARPADESIEHRVITFTFDQADGKNTVSVDFGQTP